MDTTTAPPEAADTAPVSFDWRRPLRVARLARRVSVGPWEALAWLEAALADFEAQADAFGGAGGDGLPWPPDG